MTRPTITLIVLCYNHERYIAEALEGAFSQKHSPLEIIVVDDFSKDNSLNIIEKVSGEYGGSHQVRVVRNSKNHGIAGSLHIAVSHAKGELIVLAAGDDISLPDRIDTIYETWEDSGRRAMGLFSSYRMIDSDGGNLGVGGTRAKCGNQGQPGDVFGNLHRFLIHRTPMVNGCTAAWSAELFRVFPTFQSGLEDVVLSFRSLASAELHYIDRPLVNWRRHSQNVSFLAEEVVKSFEERENRLKWVDEMTVKAYDDMMVDIGVLQEQGALTDIDYKILRDASARRRAQYSVELRLLEAGWLKRILVWSGAMRNIGLRCALRLLPRLLPRAIYKMIYAFRTRSARGRRQ